MIPFAGVGVLEGRKVPNRFYEGVNFVWHFSPLISLSRRQKHTQTLQVSPFLNYTHFSPGSYAKSRRL
jgi:hypothetical protein